MSFNSCQTSPNVNSNRGSTTPPPQSQPKSVLDAIRTGKDLAALVDGLTPDLIKEYVLKRSYITELAQQVRLNPGAVAGRIPVMRNMMEWLYDPHAPTSLRNFFNTSKKTGENLISALPIFSNNWALDSSRLELSAQVKLISDGVDRLLITKGITDRATRDQIFVRVIEEGTGVYAKQVGQGKALDAYIQRHRDNYNRWMQGHGIDGTTAQQLRQLAEGYIAANEVARRVATESGLAVGKEEGIGFIHRVLSPEARRILREKKATLLEQTYSGRAATPEGNTLKGRAVYDFIPEDQMVVAEVLGFKLPDNSRIKTRRAAIDHQAQKVETYMKKMREPDPRYQDRYDELVTKANNYREKLQAGTPGYSKAAYTKILNRVTYAQAKIGQHSPKYNQSTLDVMYDKLEQMEYDLIADMEEPLLRLAEVLDGEGRLLGDVVQGLDDSTLNMLVDTGVMHKIPMTSTRLMDYMVDRYELPFESLRELMVTDPAKAFDHYVSQLNKGLRNSTLTRNVVRGAAEEGWGVSHSAYLANPDKYGSYVSMGEVLKGYQDDPSKLGFDDPDVLNNLYVHPDVANQYIANLDMSTNPVALHSVVRVINNLSKTSMLTSASFVVKNLYGAMVAGWQAGMNVAAYPMDVAKALRVTADGGSARIMDDTTPRYGGLTERQLYFEAVSAGLLDGTNLVGENFKLTDAPQSLTNRLRYIKAQLNQGRPIRALGRTVEGAQEGFGNVLAKLLYITTVLEDTAKFTALKTALDQSTATKFASVMSGSRFKGNTLQEAVTHVQRHFVDFNDSNRVDQFLRSSVFPFWMYTSRNLPLQVRYAMRNPGRFMAYYRLAGLMNEQARDAGEDFPEAGQNPWDADGMPIYFRQGDSWIRTDMSTYDPILETMSLVTRNFVDSSQQQQVESKLGDRTLGKELVNYFTSQTYGTIKTLMAVYTQQDPFTGIPLREADSLLGVKMPEIAGLPAGLTRYVLENNLPFVRQLNRNNPGGIFGVSELRDTHGAIVRESRRSFFGVGATRYDRDPFIQGKDYEVPVILQAARLFGVAQEIDIVSNVQRANDFYNRSGRRFGNESKKLYDRYQQSSDPQEREQLLSEYFVHLALSEQMVVEANRTSLWLEKRGEITGQERREQTDALKKLQAEYQRLQRDDN